MAKYFGGIEAGGTKFICAIGTEAHEIVEEIRIPTTTPEETLIRCIDFFKQYKSKYNFSSIGVGSFGPIDLNKESSTFGFVLSSPKPGWQNIDFASRLEKELQIPVGFDTDVNAGALAEYQWGGAQDLDTFIYFTIGTGIGGGAMANGKLLHGLTHPEMGHCFIPYDSEHDQYSGKCPYHANKCFEGLASGPAIEERWDKPAEELPEDHEAWSLEAHYIALGLINCITILSPERIILGGSVMEQKQLFPLIRTNVQKYLNDYIIPLVTDDLNDFIVPASFGNNTGILGALALAKNAISSKTE